SGDARRGGRCRRLISDGPDGVQCHGSDPVRSDSGHSVTVCREAAIHMNRSSHGIVSSAVFAALLFMQGAAYAIEKPTQAVAPDAAAETPPVTIAPTDETQFQQVLQRVTMFRNLRGLDVGDQVLDQLSRGEADKAVAALSALAEKGNRKADIAL